MKNKHVEPMLSLKQVMTERGAFRLAIDDMSIYHGQIACVVGPNGGGKTTLLLTILGLLPHSGECSVDGDKFDGTQIPVKAKIGFIPDDPELLFEELTSEEQWGITASALVGQGPVERREKLMRNAKKLAKKLSFEPPEKIAKHYSHGMRKKTQMVNGLIGSPDLIIIDELRNGLDPIAIKQSEDLIRDEKKRGAAILAATHDLWWAERFADYIYVINDGSIVAQGTLEDLIGKNEKNLEDAFFRIVGEERS